jgi:alpha-mannosidase
VQKEGPVAGEVRAEGFRLVNGLLDVEAAEDGTLRIGSVDGVGRIVDGGDFGDTYNYAPPAADTVIDQPDSVSVEVAAGGPLRAELLVMRRYRWPLGVLEDGSARTQETAPVDVVTHVELRAGERFVRLRVSFDNPSRDHRVRLHVPLATAASGSAAEGQFAVVERGLGVEGGYGERAVATFPARGFVSAGGMALLLEHVAEYEVVDGRELALTLLRSTGLISRNENPWREDPAGPEVAVPDAQMIGRRGFEFAVLPHPGSWADADVVAEMERFHHPFLTAPGTAEGVPAAEGGLAIEGDGIALSSLRRRDGWIELRLVRQSPRPGSAAVSGAFREVRDADLRGRATTGPEAAPGRVRLDLEPWEIRTVQLR